MTAVAVQTAPIARKKIKSKIVETNAIPMLVSKCSTINHMIALSVSFDQIPKTTSSTTKIIIAANPAFTPNE